MRSLPRGMRWTTLAKPDPSRRSNGRLCIRGLERRLGGPRLMAVRSRTSGQSPQAETADRAGDHKGYLEGGVECDTRPSQCATGCYTAYTMPIASDDSSNTKNAF